MFWILGRISGFLDVFWIVGRVFGLWDVFLDSGKCFGFWDMFLDSGKCFGFGEVFWILGSVLSLRATVKLSKKTKKSEWDQKFGINAVKHLDVGE